MPAALPHTRRLAAARAWLTAAVAGAGAVTTAIAPVDAAAHLRSAVIASCALVAGWYLRQATAAHFEAHANRVREDGQLARSPVDPQVELAPVSTRTVDAADGSGDVWAAWPELRNVPPLASGVALPDRGSTTSADDGAGMAPVILHQSSRTVRTVSGEVDGRQLAARLAGTAVDLDRQAAGIAESQTMAADVAADIGAHHARAARAGDHVASAGMRARASADAVRALGDAVGRTEALVATLARLARQTHRVALNASIEATRAGEDGRAFAAVADALRRLAQDGGQAAQAASAVAADARDEVTRAGASAEAVAQEAEAARATVSNLVTALGRTRDTAATLDATLADIAGRSGDTSTTARAVAAMLHG